MRIKKLNENAILPQRTSKEAAGYDLYACISAPIIIAPHQTVFIGTGLAMEIPKGFFGGIVARSGIACKNGIAPANKFGVLDSDYRSEVKVALHNHSDIPYTVSPMDRVAQLLIMPYYVEEMVVVDELDETERGDRGFGGSGK